MELAQNLKRLPQELVLQIWSYTYSPQSPILLADIRDYLQSLDYIQCYYLDKYIDSGYNEYMYWIIHDIFGYISFFYYDNDHNLYNLFWRRAIQCSGMNSDELSSYIYRLENNKIDTQMRILWAMFYPEERDEFIDSIEYFISESTEVSDEEYEEDFDF